MRWGGDMTFVEVIEVARSSKSKRKTYLIIILCALAIILAVSAAEFSGFTHSGKPRELVDFDDFYIAGQLVRRGEIEKAYRFATMSELQKAISGTEAFLPWTYPPQFDLLVAPLALLPLGLAYALFVGGTLAAYLLTLKRIAAANFVSVLIVICPAILITIKCGQNGFLTGALIGLTCIGLQARSAWAGLPLGLMIIKPHLAIGFALYTLVNRRWSVAGVAAATVIATSALATALLGPTVWTALLDGVKEARVFLEQGFYPLYRMISIYAVLRSIEQPYVFAMAAQLLVAMIALATVVFASRKLDMSQALGVTAIASLLISPYAYDYDLPILGIGFALLLPDLMRLGSDRERLTLYGLALFMGGFGIAQIGRLPDSAVITIESMPLSLAGVSLVAIVALIWRILRRNEARLMQDDGVPATYSEAASRTAG
jgi:hypothetical protein